MKTGENRLEMIDRSLETLGKQSYLLTCGIVNVVYEN